MKDLVLDLLVSYEHRVSAVESLVSSAYEATGDSDETLARACEEGERLRANLQEVLARNRFLRRKDFDTLMAKVFSDIERKKREIEEERKQVRERVRAYLTEQKELVASLKEQLTKFTEDSGRENLAAVLSDIKASYTEEGEQTFGMLRDFQLHLESFRQEQEMLNDRLKRLSDRGKSLTIEDLRQLEASKDRQKRKAERKLRRQDVERLLAHFRQQRQETIVIGDSET
ncbi:MAG: hypothetical protein FJ005_07850 [Chloroflexi bacterium]|nr:hypothetical protein [Chloroflexota bacterium]